MSTPEHSNDSSGPVPMGFPQPDEESVSMASMASGGYIEKHKKLKKKKKKKEKDRTKDKHEKKHKHRHKVPMFYLMEEPSQYILDSGVIIIIVL